VAAYKDLFDAGHTLKDIHVWLNEAGIEIGYARLSTYLGQLRRRDQATALAETVSALSETNARPRPSAVVFGQRCGAGNQERSGQRVGGERSARQRPGAGKAGAPVFQFNSEPDSKKLI